jgi:phage terminase large subunit-like protein
VEPLRGTRTGRQEIEAELLEDVDGALWTRAMIDEHRVAEAPQLGRIVVAVDPNTTSGEASDDAGIVVVGRGHSDRHGYVLADHTVTRGGPAAWALAAVRAYHEFQADRVVAEANNGGEMVAITIRSVDASVPVKIVHASRGKRTRAEPVASLYTPLEGIRDALVHHVGSAASFADLEDEMTTWTGDGESPNRMDALVWALTELNLWQPVGRHRSGHAKGGRRSIPGAKLGDGLGELSAGAGVGGYTSGGYTSG